MGQIADNCQFTKILVQRYEDASLSISSCQNDIIAGVFIPILTPHRIMPGFSQSLANSAGYARVQQDFHYPVSIMKGSTRSRPTNRRA